MDLRDMLADGVRVGPDDVIDIGAVRDAAGNYRRATTTLREIANLMLDELAARGVPIPPAPPRPARESAPELEPSGARQTDGTHQRGPNSPVSGLSGGTHPSGTYH
jgi:hypothetical protein